MKYLQLFEKLKPSQYRPYVKGWDREKYKDIFLDPKYEHDRNGYRIYIPIEHSGEDIEPVPFVKQMIEDEGYRIEDYVNGYAVSYDGKRRMKIGKILKNGQEKSEDHHTKGMFRNALTWFTADPNRAAHKDKHICVISRHPYDIAGMATDRGWATCMNLDAGTYIGFIEHDVEYGTLIAYGVKESDRNIQRPVCRVLMKPFVSSKYPDLVHFGIENRVYGTTVPGFLDVVETWVDEVNSNNELGEVVVVGMPPMMYADDIVRVKTIGPNVTNIKSTKIDLDDLQEYMYIEAVSLDPSEIRNIDDPSEAVQLAAVEEDGFAIQYILSPSEEVQMVAVANEAHALDYIENPSDRVIITAMKEDIMIINSLENPSEEIQLAAIKIDPWAIDYIENPTENVQIAAVTAEPYTLNSIKNPSAAVRKLGKVDKRL